MSIDYGWIITKDFINQGKEVGIIGPSGVSDAVTAQLIRGEGSKFRLYDDDCNLYYEGIQITGNNSDEGCFAPLDDFGTPNAGCTYMKVENAEGKWEEL